MIKTIAIVVCCLFANLAHAQRGATRVASQFEWRKDLQYLAEELPKVHPDPWARISEDEFRAAVDELSERMPTMSEGQTTFEISRIVGLLGDQNTLADVSRPMYLAPVLPVRFVSLADGMYVNAAATRYQSIIGARVVSLCGIPIEELGSRAAAFGSWENETTRQRVIADLLRFPAVLMLSGIDNARANLTLEFQHEGEDETRIRKLEAIPLGGTHGWHTWMQRTQGPTPVSVMASSSPYVSAFLGASNTMFVSVNTQTEDEREPFGAFVTNMMKEIDERNAKRIVIDLRFNDDRSDSMLDPMLDALAEAGWFSTPGDVIVLIGRLTSATSAQDAARFAERGAITMGVPTGGNPAGCSGEQELKLPNSGMPIRVSARGWTATDVRTLEPDVLIPWTSGALFNASDPVLDAALEHAPEMTGEG